MTSSVYREIHACNKGSSIRGQEGNCLSHFLHLTWSAKGMCDFTLLKELQRQEETEDTCIIISFSRDHHV